MDGERRADAFRAVAYPAAKGCVAIYFPEANVLVPLESVAETSNIPAPSPSRYAWSEPRRGDGCLVAEPA